MSLQQLEGKVLFATQLCFDRGGIRNEKRAFNALPGKAEIERRSYFETYVLLINGYVHFITNLFCKYVLKRATSKPRL
jgi:hypothetical protein